MAYKREFENFHTAIYYGQSYNRFNLYEFDQKTGWLSLSKYFLDPGKVARAENLCRYNILTGVFESTWPRSSSCKASIGNMLMECMAVWGVKHINGAAGFVKLWGGRLEKIEGMRQFKHDFEIQMMGENDG